MHILRSQQERCEDGWAERGRGEMEMCLLYVIHRNWLVFHCEQGTGHPIQCLWGPCCKQRMTHLPTEHWDIPLFLDYCKENLIAQLLHLKCDINLGKKRNLYLFPEFGLRKNMLWGTNAVEEK